MKINNKIFITLLFFASASLIFVVFNIWLLKGIQKDSEDLIKARNDIATLNAAIAEAENFKKNYDAYKPNFDKIDQLFIDPADPVDFIKFLENTAYDRQITSKITLLPSIGADSKGDENFIVFQFSSQGDFSDILNFSKEIESGPYLVEIKNLSIQNYVDKTATKESPKESPLDYSSGKVDATFTIKAFIKPS